MDIIHHIKKSLKLPLPGAEIQNQMAPNGRQEYVDRVSDYKQAAVLSLIYPKNDVAHMVFIQRSSNIRDKHSAQIAFPGGRVEEVDESLIDTALREANEEVGVDPSSIQVLRELTPLKIPVSGYEVFPVLAFSEQEILFSRQVSEVERVIEVPIEDLIDPSNRKLTEIVLSSGIKLKNVPAFEFDRNVIWGATSMMLNEVIEILT